MVGLDIFQGPFYLKLHLFIHLRFHATFWAPDIVPFSSNRYFLKLSMLFANKLIDRHYILLTENILLEAFSKIGFWFKIPSSPKGFAGTRAADL